MFVVVHTYVFTAIHFLLTKTFLNLTYCQSPISHQTLLHKNKIF